MHRQPDYRAGRGDNCDREGDHYRQSRAAPAKTMIAPKAASKTAPPMTSAQFMKSSLMAAPFLRRWKIQPGYKPAGQGVGVNAARAAGVRERIGRKRLARNKKIGRNGLAVKITLRPP